MPKQVEFTPCKPQEQPQQPLVAVRLQNEVEDIDDLMVHVDVKPKPGQAFVIVGDSPG